MRKFLHFIWISLILTFISGGVFAYANSEDEASLQYTVKEGDTLAKISNTIGISMEDIASANHVKNYQVRVGQKLTIPGDKITIPILSSKGKTSEDFIPRGWILLDSAEGDLNKDLFTDKVVVIERNIFDSDEWDSPRILFVIFQRKDKTYDMSIQSNTIIMRKSWGGVKGDPFYGVSINRGSILVSHFGGSREWWSSLYRFRFQNKGWFLIGETIEGGDGLTGECDYRDTNLLTGESIHRETDSAGQESIKKEKLSINPLRNLNDFVD